MPAFRIVPAFKSAGETTDRERVRAMRARMTMKLVSIMVLLALTVVGARSCSGSSPSSDTNPVNVARNGVAALCANEQATAAASGDGTDTGGASPVTVASPSALQQFQAQNPAGYGALTRALGGPVSCPTTTTVEGAGGN